MKLRHAIALIAFVAVQFLAFEGFERFYYRFEDRYNKYTARLGTVPLSRLFDDSAVAAADSSSYGDIAYVDDEYGFRTVDIDYDDKTGPRVVFVGSFSMGYGTGVPADRTFPAAFGAAMKELRPGARLEVVNANRGAQSVDGTMRALGDDLLNRVRPDVVVLGAYVNNRAFPPREGTTAEERVFSERVRGGGGDTTVRRGGMIIVTELTHSDLWYEVYSRSYVLGRFLSYVDMKSAQILDRLGRLPERGDDHAGYVQDLHRYLSDNGVELVVAILPQLGGERNDFRTLVNDQLRALCAEHGIPLLDIDEVRPPHVYTYVADGHYSVRSNELVGTDIARWLDGILDEDFDAR